MSCLHPYSDFAVHLRSCWIVSCLAFVLRVWYADGQNVNLQFPVFNDSTFTCTGIPYVLGYATCFYTNSAGDAVEVLPSAYNNIYTDQAARFMYSTPIVFENPTGTVQASFSTFFIFSISHVGNRSHLGGGFAFMVAPEINTPDNSASGGFGMFPMDPKTGRSISSAPMVMGVEFDTSLTPGIDTVPVPHIGIDITDLGGNSGVPSNTTQISATDYLDTPVGMWIDYNSTLYTMSVYCVPVNGTDASAAGMKPDTPIVTMGGLRVESQLNRRSYVGFGASVFGGGFEENLLYYWSFQTFGFPPLSLLAQWYQWWAPLSTTAKVGLIAGAVVGTVGGAYLCSECLFFCFFKRIKNPQTEAEQRWPVRRRESLPGVRPKRQPPRKKVRDSLSVANPLYLWEAPLEPAEEPDEEAQESPTAGIPEESELSENEDTPLMSPPGIGEGKQIQDEDEDEAEATPDIEEGEQDQYEAEATPDIEEGEQDQYEAEATPDIEEGEPDQYEAEAIIDVESMAKAVQRSSKRLSNRRESTSTQASTKSVPVRPPAEGNVPANAVSIERSFTAAKRKSTPAVAEAPGSPIETKLPKPPQAPAQGAKPGSPPQQRPSQAPRKPSQGSPPPQRPSQAPRKPSQGSPPQQRPSPAARKPSQGSPPQQRPSPAPRKPSQGSPPQQRPSQAPRKPSQSSPPQQRLSQAPRKPSQGVQPGSPPQQRPSPAPRRPSQGVQGAKPSSPPQQRPPPTPKGAMPTSPLKEGQSQGAKQATPQPATKLSPPKTSPTAPQTSLPRGQRPSQLLTQEPPKAPRPSPQTSPPKAAPRRPSRQAASKAVKPRPPPGPPPKSPKKNA